MVADAAADAVADAAADADASEHVEEDLIASTTVADDVNDVDSVTARPLRVTL